MCYRYHLHRLASVLLCGALHACSIYSLPGQQPAPVVEPPGSEVRAAPSEEEARSAPATPIDTGGPDSEGAPRAATESLLQRAEREAASGQYDNALALLERAQRIDPDSAEIYLAMAETHCARGDLEQCRATAERGLLYCRDRQQCRRLATYTER